MMKIVVFSNTAAGDSTNGFESSIVEVAEPRSFCGHGDLCTDPGT